MLYSTANADSEVSRGQHMSSIGLFCPEQRRLKETTQWSTSTSWWPYSSSWQPIAPHSSLTKPSPSVFFWTEALWHHQHPTLTAESSPSSV